MKDGAPERSRTSDLLIRSQPLYPTELRARSPTLPYASAKAILRGRVLVTSPNNPAIATVVKVVCEIQGSSTSQAFVQ